MCCCESMRTMQTSWISSDFFVACEQHQGDEKLGSRDGINDDRRWRGTERKRSCLNKTFFSTRFPPAHTFLFLMNHYLRHGEASLFCPNEEPWCSLGQINLDIDSAWREEAREGLRSDEEFPLPRIFLCWAIFSFLDPKFFNFLSLISGDISVPLTLLKLGQI